MTERSHTLAMVASVWGMMSERTAWNSNSFPSPRLLSGNAQLNSQPLPSEIHVVKKSIEVFYKPHKSRRREGEFAEFLAARLGEILINERFRFDPGALDCLIGTDKLLACLNAESCLPTGKRRECINEVTRLPSRIRVATDTFRVSFDNVVVRESRPYYWEFHELQHRQLSVSKGTPVYGSDGQEHRVPRFLQRLIRDVWRVQAFPDVSIVWCDWFDAQWAFYHPLIEQGFREYYAPGQFSFTAFISRVM